jgi:hypothetical protein
MVKEAEEFADEDAKVRETIDAKNGFESYVYGVKNTIKDDKKAAKLSDEDKETVEAEIKKAQEWLEENPKASKDEFDETQKAMEKVVSPIMSKLYQGGKPPGDEGSSAMSWSRHDTARISLSGRSASRWASKAAHDHVRRLCPHSQCGSDCSIISCARATVGESGRSMRSGSRRLHRLAMSPFRAPQRRICICN